MTCCIECIRGNMEPITTALIRRLTGKGIELKIIPALLRDTVNTFKNGNMSQNLKELNKRIQLLGWYDFEMDEYTFQLLVANIENQDLAEISGNVI
jgi:hypothetical protein